MKRKKEEIWLSHITKAPNLTEKSKKQLDNIKNANKNLHNNCDSTSYGQLE